MSRFDPERHPQVTVHESAYVDEPCEIGAGTSIWHFSHVMAGAVIGRGCTLGQNVLVSPDVRLGDNVKVQNNVSIYTGVVLEDDVFCGPSMVFTNVINPRSEIVRRGEYRPTIVSSVSNVASAANIASKSLYLNNTTMLSAFVIWLFPLLVAGTSAASTKTSTSPQAQNPLGLFSRSKSLERNRLILLCGLIASNHFFMFSLSLLRAALYVVFE